MSRKTSALLLNVKRKWVNKLTAEEKQNSKGHKFT